MNPKVQTVFEMRIADIFRLTDQRAIIVGVVDDHPELVGRTACRVVVDGVEKGTITITGEEMPLSPKRNRDHRALSTNDTVPLDNRTVASADCRLIGIAD